MAENNEIKIIGICGSLRVNGYTRKAVKLALEGAKTQGAIIELLDLRHYELPFCKQFDDPEEKFPDLVTIKKILSNANGIILGTPEYHGSFSGVLKNFLDLLGFQEFEGKIVGLIGVAGGSIGAINALNGLRLVARQLHAWVIPSQVSIPRVSQAFNSDGELIKEGIVNRIKNLGKEVSEYSYLHDTKNSSKFLQLWERGPKNPGVE